MVRSCARKLPQAAVSLQVCPGLETLEERLVLSWNGAPPPHVKVPRGTAPVVLDLQSDAQGTGSITSWENDYYQITAPVSGYYYFRVHGQAGLTSPIVAVFNAHGRRLGFSSDTNRGGPDRELLMNLVAGRKYFFGIAKQRGSLPGSYTWQINGPAPGPADDGFEENDNTGNAINLGTLTGLRTESGLVMGDSADWFRFRMINTGSAEDYVRIQFQDAQGDLDLVVYNLALVEVGRSTGTGDVEEVSLNGLSPGVYYVHVYGFQGVRNPNYTLQINPGHQILGGDDNFEENDTFVDAFDLGTLTDLQSYAGLVLADSDWYHFTMNGPGQPTDSVRIDFQQTEGDLALELYNAAGSLLARSDSATGTESISLDGLAAGTYYVTVYGHLGATNPSYALEIDPGIPQPEIGFNLQLSFAGITPSQRVIFNQAAERWAQIITGDLPDAVFKGKIVDDVFIEAFAFPIDGPNGILGAASPDAFRADSSLPYHGMMVFDTADLAELEADGSLRDVILHEMGHVLGFGTIWDRLNLLSGAGTTNPRYVGPLAIAEYNGVFGLSGDSVPVEGQAGPGSNDSHWRETIFANELMTPYLSGATRPLSRITIASLADLGYTVNWDAADDYTPPSSVVGASEAASTATNSVPLRRAADSDQRGRRFVSLSEIDRLILADDGPGPPIRRPGEFASGSSSALRRDRPAATR